MCLRRFFIILICALGFQASNLESVFACEVEDLNLFLRLGYSSSVAQKICNDRSNSARVKKRAERNFESSRVVKVYRGITVDPKDYVPNQDLSSRGIYVCGADHIAPYALVHSTVQYLNKNPYAIVKAEAGGYILYGTMIEYEMPKYFFTDAMIYGTIPLEQLPNGAKDLPIYTARIAKVDVERAALEKALRREARFGTEGCNEAMSGIDFTNRPLYQWSEF